MSVSARPFERDHGGARAAGQRDARDAKALARSRREAIRRRTRRIRRSVAAVAVTLFAVAFLVVYVQLASGHDPALVANAEKRAASAGGVGSETSSSATSEASGESSASGSGAGSEESSGASALTTSQS
jgi:hypothetical protein